MSDFKKARDEAAKLFVTDGDCEIMDTTMAHEDTFKAGSNWARDFILNSEEMKRIVNSLKSTVGYEPFNSLEPRPISEGLAAFEKLKKGEDK